jgi:hypothetical protein
VDLIVEPSAGGGLLRLVEASAGMEDEPMNMIERFLQAVPQKQARDSSSTCPADVLLDAFFARDQKFVNSFRECYIQITGDKRCTGRLEDCDQVRLREALDGNSWANVLANSVNRRVVAEYRRDSHLSVWRNLVTIARDINSFRTQERVRYGGYGDLPTVNQGSPYLALPSPGDEKATYAVTKRGGTETLTLEMIKNDDVQAIRIIPKRLAEAAQRTLAHFVLDFVRTNPVIYDGVTLFHASHGNLGTAPLSAVGLAAARAAMKRQTELGSGEQLGIDLRFLWVPVDLEETGVNLFRRGANQDKTFVQSLDVKVVPVWYWTDANDWCVSADPSDCPTIEVGFLEGEEEPAIFVQDAPTVGSMFTNDHTTLKIRHIYGGAVSDYRGVYKSVV